MTYPLWIVVKVKACYINFVLLLVVGVLTNISGLALWLVIPGGRMRGRLFS
ncbi:MAG: hypothetical protein QXV95_07280 [Sulfolobales archaeon]